MRWLLLAGGLAVGMLGVRGAGATYTEAHQVGDEVRLRVDATGRAHVEHTLAWRVIAGQKHVIDLVGVEGGAVAEPLASITDEEGQAFPAHVAERPGPSPNVLEATLDDPKGMRRGRYQIRISYDIDLVGEHELVAEGASWRLAWTAPIPPDGYDAARVIVELPSAPTKPRAVQVDSDALDDAVIATLRGDGENDTIELVRAHVARGESATWSILVAPQALSALSLTSNQNATAKEPAHVPLGRRPLGLALLAGIGLAYGALVRKRKEALERTCRAAGTYPMGLVPLPAWSRAPIAGAAIALGVGLEAASAPVLGAFLLATGMSCAVLRPARVPEVVRGPGRWLALRPDEVFARRRLPSDVDEFDLATHAGKLTLVVLAVLVTAAAMLARRFVPSVAHFVWLDVATLIPLFAPGPRSELPPDVGTLGRVLRPLYARLVRSAALRVAPWARVPAGAHDPDEVRILVLPRPSMPGVVGIEVGLAHAGVATGTLPEVLVRVREASAASARMTVLTPRLVPLPGRQPEERVYRLSPRFPTLGFTHALVERLARELLDRRTTALAWSGGERRVPPEERARSGPSPLAQNS